MNSEQIQFAHMAAAIDLQIGKKPAEKPAFKMWWR